MSTPPLLEPACQDRDAWPLPAMGEAVALTPADAVFAGAELSVTVRVAV